MATEALRELAVLFKYRLDKSSEAAIGKSVEKVKSTVATIGESLVSAFGLAKITGFISNQLQVATTLQDVSEKFGIAKKDIQEFQFALQMNGSTAEVAGESLKFLSKNLQAAKEGSKEAQDSFRALGIDFGSAASKLPSMTELLDELQVKFTELGPGTEATKRALELFGRGGTEVIQTLTGASGSLSELRKRAHEVGYVLSDETAKAADDAADTMVEWRGAVRGLSFAFTADLLPRLRPLILRATDIVVGFQKLVKQTDIARYTTIAFGVGAGAAILTLAGNVTKLLGLSGQGGISGLLSALLRFGPIIAIVVGLGLAFEDLLGFIQGNDSLIGYLLQKFLGFDEALKIQQGLQSSFSELGKSLTQLIGPATDLFKLIVGLGVDALPYVTKGIAIFLKLLEQQIRGITGLINGVVGAVKEAKQGNFGRAVDRLGEGIISGFKASPAGLAIAGVGELALASTPTAYAPFDMTASAREAPAYLTQTNNITIQGGGPDVGRRVADAMTAVGQDQLRATKAALGK